MGKTVFDVIVVGGGPAGLTAALYTARAGMRTLLIAGASSVSQITLTDALENYPGFPEGIGGYELLERFKRQVDALGVAMLAQDALDIKRADCGISLGNNAETESSPCWELTAGDGDDVAAAYLSHTIIIATGTTWRRMGVEGEETFLGRGISFCATCDGPLYRGKEVVVVGGGDAAVQEALFLTNFVSKVTLIHRRDRLRAAALLQQRARNNPKIAFLWNTEIVKINGEKTVASVSVKDVVSSQTQTVPADGVFVFIGLTPNTGFLQNLVKLSPNGAIIVDERMRTSASGVFAAGDCVEKSLRQVITACGDGALAAQQAQHFVEDRKGIGYPTYQPRNEAL